MPTRLFEGPNDFREIHVNNRGCFIRTREKDGAVAGMPHRATRIEIDDPSATDSVIGYEVEDLENAGYKEVESDPVEPTSDYVTHIFGTDPVPARLAEFFDSGEWFDVYSDSELKKAPGYHRVSFPGRFGNPFLEMVYDVAVQVDEETRARYVPILMLDDGEATTRFFAVDTTDESCPVVFWNSDQETFVEWRDSLDAFLEDFETY